MVLVGWKPLDYNFSMPSARIRCSNIIRYFSHPNIKLEIYDPARLDQYDAVIFSKSYSEESLAEAESLKKRNKTVIFDLFDNRFFEPDNSPESAALSDRLRRMIALSDHITTSTTYLKKLLSDNIPGREITNIEDALEEDVYIADLSLSKRIRAWINYALYRLETLSTGSKTRLIWFGTSGDVRLKTGMADMFKLKDILESPAFKDKVTLTICSNGRKMYEDHIAPWNIPTHFVTWSGATFYRVLKANDVALIPITPNPLTEFKTNNRVITALYNDLAVIADAIPSYREFAPHIALDDWEAGLARFVGNKEERARAIAEGKRIISAKYMPHIIADKWAEFLGSIKIS